MSPIYFIFAAIFGAVLGSFLNALTFRYNTGAPLLRAMQGRSRCMRCGHELGVFDLVPVFSWIFLRGRCRYCGSPISLQYPLVEAVAALLSFGIAMQVFTASSEASPALPAAGAYFFWLLIWMTILFLVVYDFRHMILPMGPLLLLIVLGFASLFLNFLSPEVGPALRSFSGVGQFLAGPFLALPLFFISLISRGRWMGWGDSIFALPLGWILGIAGGFTALFLAFWSGAIVGIALLLIRTTGLTLKSEIPFGPFLALGAAMVFFSHFNLFAALGIG